MPRPREPRSCACGCGTVFLPWTPSKRYVHPSHKPRTPPHYTPAELQQRKRLLAHRPQGHPCPRCGYPMYPGQRLQTGHVIDKALGGTGHGFRWEHAHCNTSAGATLGNRLRAGKATRTTRRW